MYAIAETLGISIATVDRALKNRGRVSAETRARVLKVAEEQGYRPNLAARNLRLNRRFRVSVYLPTSIAAFFDSLRVGIEKEAALFGSTLDLQFHRFARGQERLLTTMQTDLETGIHGIITVPANSTRMRRFIQSARAKGIPVICVSTDAPESGRLTAVTPYPRYSGRIAAEVMALEIRGRGSVMVLAGDMDNLNHVEKVQGFKETLSQMAPDACVRVAETKDSPQKARECILRGLRTMPEIIGLYVTGANSLAALKTLRAKGRLREFPIITTDLFPALAPYLRDGSVRATLYQCPEIQGALATRAMYRYLVEQVVPSVSIGVIPQLVMKSNLDLYLDRHALLEESVTQETGFSMRMYPLSV